MRIPEHLISLVDEGIIDEVVRPLMSGKEAQVYLLRCGGELRVAKVYKLAQDRSFKQRAEYTEGRRVRNSRDQRAINNRTRHGREQDESAWRAAEVDVIHRLYDAGVRVPKPYQFVDGVLIMELITDGEGLPAPRLGDVELDREHALEVYEQLLREVVRMLSVGIVHGDLSDFNVLLGPEGPVIIDFPQAVHAASNQNARRLLLRDVDNLHRFRARFAPERAAPPYAEEMWQLYERGELTADTRLTGRYRRAQHSVDTGAVLGLIADAERDERKRRANQGLSARGLSDPARAAPRPSPREERAPQPPRDVAPSPARQGVARAADGGRPAQRPPQRSAASPRELAADGGRALTPPTAPAPAPAAQQTVHDAARDASATTPSKASKRRRRRRRKANERNASASGQASTPSTPTPSSARNAQRQ